jgi:hypothetical protein
MSIFSLLSPRKIAIIALLAFGLLNSPLSASGTVLDIATPTCSPGWFIDNGYCFPCYAGTYSPSGYCINCPVSTWSAAVAATSESTCQACPAGEISAPGSTSASDCFVPY